MAERQDALDALRTLLLTAVNAESGAADIQGGWVYATEYEQVTAKDLPVFIVGKVDGIDNQRGIHTHGVAYDRWRAWVILYLFYGEPEHPSREGAEAEALEEGWVKAFSKVLSDNLTISDTVVKIGEPDGNRLKLFDYQSDYWQWDAEPYWGIRFEIPIMQYIDEATSV
jgi:hypothetical protein